MVYAPLAALVLVSLSILAIALPGVLITSILWPGRELQWRWITGATLGLAFAAYSSFLISYLDIRLFGPFWIICLFVCLLVWLRSRPRPPVFSMPSHIGWMLLILLIAVGVSRTAIVAWRVVPKGWDVTFHMILTQRILLTHQIINNWLPFEDIALNYPLASHTLMAGVSSTIHLMPHQVFNILLPLLGVFATAEVYALTIAATRRTIAGLFAAGTYGFLAVVGSIDYVRWAGLPNAYAMVILLAVLRLLIDQEFSGRTWLLAILIASLIVVHHHVMLVACILLGAILVISWLRHQRILASTIFQSGIVASFLTMPQIAPYLIKTGRLTGTAVLHYETQPSLGQWISDIGWAFTILFAVGVLWYVYQRIKHVPGRIRIHWIVPVSTVILLILFLLTGILYPWIRGLLGYEALGAFTPSRFIHDAVPIAAVYSGCALYAMIRRRWLRPWTALILCMLGTFSLLPVWKSMLEDDWPVPRCEAYLWINANTPPQTLVMTSDCWAPYFCWRKSLRTPVPISEPQSFWQDRWAFYDYLNLALSHKIQPPPDAFIVRIREPGQPSDSPVIWQQDNGFSIEQLWPPMGPSAVQSPAR